MYVFLWFVACIILGWVENDTFITTYIEYFYSRSETLVERHITDYLNQ